MKIIIVATLSTLFTLGIADAQGRNYNESVNLYSFNPDDNTYNGQVTIQASPCPNVGYNVQLPAARVKDSEDAKDKVKEQVAKIAADIDKAAADMCKH
jgi:hypothetical protein